MTAPETRSEGPVSAEEGRRAPESHREADERLRRLAGEASGCHLQEGCTDPNHSWYFYGEIECRLGDGDPPTERQQADAAYIAAASPDVVLGLLDRLARAEGRLRAVAETSDLGVRSLAEAADDYLRREALRGDS